MSATGYTSFLAASASSSSMRCMRSLLTTLASERACALPTRLRLPLASSLRMMP